MNKKRLIILIAAVAVLIAAIAVPAGIHAKKTVKVDCVYPYSMTVGKNSVKIRISGSGKWSAAQSEAPGLTVKQDSSRRFTIGADDVSSENVSFLLTEEEGEHFISVNVSRDADGKLCAAHGAAVSRDGEKEFCTDTKFPVKIIPGRGGSTEILFPGAPAGKWETEAPEGLTVSSGFNDAEGRHYTVSAAAAGEYTVVFSDLLRGLTSTVVLSADGNGGLSPVSATQGNCAKSGDEKLNVGPKEEPDESIEAYY